MEADPRHAELIIEQLELNATKGVSTPGVDDQGEEEDEAQQPLEPQAATAFRGIAARCNYLAADRPDIMYPVKELCREMSAPTNRSMSRLERVGRHLLTKPRQTWRYDWQAPVHEMDVNTDANWCGCKIGRKSTSGGTILRGGHLIKAWSKTQAIIAKSSAESELYAMVKGTCEGLGVCTLLKDFGETNPQARLHIDASAAKGIVERKGLGKVRHIDVDVLWLQEQEARRLVPLYKCLGTDNVADMMTKHIPAATIDHYSSSLAVEYPAGRSEIAQKLHVVEKVLKPDVGKSGRGELQGEQERLIDAVSSTYSDKDAWTSRGLGGSWNRQHRRARRSLFTPLRVAQGPDSGVHLMRIRTTNGVNLMNLQKFTVVDDWTQAANAHKVLDFPWVGNTVFQEVNDSITLIDTSNNASIHNTISSLSVNPALSYRFLRGKSVAGAGDPSSGRSAKIPAAELITPCDRRRQLQRIDEQEKLNSVEPDNNCNESSVELETSKSHSFAHESGAKEGSEELEDIDAGICTYRCQNPVNQDVMNVRSEPNSGILLSGYTGQGFGCGTSACMPTRPLKQHPYVLASCSVSHVRGTRGCRQFPLPMMRSIHALPHARRAVKFYPLFASFYPSLGDGCLRSILVRCMQFIRNENSKMFRPLAGGSGMILLCCCVYCFPRAVILFQLGKRRITQSHCISATLLLILSVVHSQIKDMPVPLNGRAGTIELYNNLFECTLERSVLCHNLLNGHQIWRIFGREGVFRSTHIMTTYRQTDTPGRLRDIHALLSSVIVLLASLRILFVLIGPSYNQTSLNRAVYISVSAQV